MGTQALADTIFLSLCSSLVAYLVTCIKRPFCKSIQINQQVGLAYIWPTLTIRVVFLTPNSSAAALTLQLVATLCLKAASKLVLSSCFSLLRTQWRGILRRRLIGYVYKEKKKKNISKKKKLSLPTSEVLGDVEPPKPQHPTDNLCLYIHICVAKGSQKLFYY